MFVHVFTKHGLGKVFQCLRILIFLQKVEDNSVNNEEWACHKYLSALRERKCPKLSIANVMKWPDKPAE